MVELMEEGPLQYKSSTLLESTTKFWGNNTQTPELSSLPLLHRNQTLQDWISMAALDAGW